MSKYYTTCPDCGAHLDPDEVCECQSEENRHYHEQIAAADEETTCICCGQPIPEGRQICLICEREASKE
jgi:predicted amidophosphoribosyltransferase